MIRGEYGMSPVPVDPEFAKKIIGDAELIDYRPADKIEPEIENLRKKVAPYYEKDEDILTLALFEQVAEKYFEFRKNKKYGLDGENADKVNGIHSV